MDAFLYSRVHAKYWYTVHPTVYKAGCNILVHGAFNIQHSAFNILVHGAFNIEQGAIYWYTVHSI